MRFTNTFVRPVTLAVLVACVVVASLFSQATTLSAAAVDQRAGNETAVVDRSATRIAQLIEQLGDASFHQRESAQSALMAIGLPAFEQLRLAANLTPDPEVARAARYLLDSQQVRWSLETDSIQVRDIVEHYNAVNQDGRRTRFDQLARNGSNDALMALVRFVRYESDEILSKFAALSLMETLTSQGASSAGSSPDTADRKQYEELLRTIQEAVGKKERPGCLWLEQCCSELEKLMEGKLPDASRDASPWKGFAADLAATALSEQRDPSRQLAERFHYWMGGWITQTRDRATAVDASRPVLELVQSKGGKLDEVCKWLLDGQLPELLIELGGQQPEQFEKSPRLGFLLAEAYGKQGDASKADQQAEATSRRIGEYVREQMRTLNATVDTPRVEAYRRSDIARELKRRGMYDWCETELKSAIEILAKSRQSKKKAGVVGGELPSDMEITTRLELSQFYWEAGQNEQAAATLRPVELLYASDQFQKDLAYVMTRSDVGALYNFYAGLDCIDNGQVEAASKFLLAAMGFQEQAPNPDIVIAYRKLAASEPYATEYAKMLESMSDYYRQQLLTLERQLAAAHTRVEQRSVQRSLARSCNVLAWLLACCETDTEEALQLGRRAVELEPQEPAYMDTLARSLYADGKIEAAIRMQEEVIGLAPHERQYKSQLYFLIKQRDKTKAINDS